MRRLARYAVLLAFGAIVAGAVWLVRFATSDDATAWLVQKAVTASNGRLAIEGASGALVNPVRVASVRYEDETIRVTARDITFRLALHALLSLRVELATLAVGEVEVAQKSGTTEPATPPDDLTLPIALAIEDAALGKLTVLRASGGRFEAHAISFAYRGSPTGHGLHGLRVDTDLGTLKGDATIDAKRPFAVAGTLSAARAHSPFPGTVRAVFGGSLEQLDVMLNGAVASIEFDGTAALAPFAASRLTRAHVRAAKIDLAQFNPALPATRLTVEAQGVGRADGTIAGGFALRNATPGPVTDHRLPLVQLAADFALRESVLALSALHADLGAGGAATGSATVTVQRADLDLAVRRLDLRAIHRPLRATALDGTIAARIDGKTQSVRAELTEGTLRFGLDAQRAGDEVAIREFAAQAGGSRLSGTGTIALSGAQRFAARASLERFDPAAYGNFPSARINATIAATGALAPAWQVNAHFDVTPSEWRKAPLTGSGRITVAPTGIRDADVTMRVGRNIITARGALGKPDDVLTVSADATRLAELDPRIAGQAKVAGTLRGALTRPTVDAQINAQELRLLDSYRIGALTGHGTLHSGDEPRIELDLNATALGNQRFTLAAAALQVSGSAMHHEINLRGSTNDLAVTTRLVGRWQSATWQGTIESLTNQGQFPVQLASPVAIEVGRDKVVVGAAAATFGDGRVTLQGLRWAPGRLASQGEFTSIALKPFLALVKLPPGTTSTLILRGAWAIDTTPRLNGSVTLARESGDLAVGAASPMPLELEQLELAARLVDDAVTGTVTGKSRRAGMVNARFDIGRSPSAPPGEIALDAPLALEARAEIATLRPLVAFAQSGAIADGRLAATLTGTGTLRDPKITGRIEGSALSLDVPTYGIRLTNGRLAARLERNALQLDEFSIHGGDGLLSATGVAQLDGEATTLTWRAENLRLLGLPDMRVTVDGEGTIAVQQQQPALEGSVRVRDGYIAFARDRGDKLGDDVEVIGETRPKSQQARRTIPLKLALDIDLGQHFHIIGAGLDTDLNGRLRLATPEKGQLTAQGEIIAVRGIYFFLGQRLEIERGRLIFDGPIENPALDVRAVRKGLQVEPGVELTGTLRTPRVTLTSEPPVPDGEKLAWLVLGRSLDTASAADAVLLQSAAASLLASDQQIPLGRRVALALGLDDISLKGGSQLAGQVVAVGKRLSDRVYLTFEQGLAAAQSTVSLEYLLGRGFRLRASGGQSNNIGVFFNRSWD